MPRKKSCQKKFAMTMNLECRSMCPHSIEKRRLQPLGMERARAMWAIKLGKKRGELLATIQGGDGARDLHRREEEKREHREWEGRGKTCGYRLHHHRRGPL